MIEYIYIKDIDGFYQHLDFIIESVNKIREKNKENEYSVEQVVSAIKRKVGDEDFLILLQAIDGQVKGFVSANVFENFFQEKVGFIWLMTMNSGSDIKHFFEEGRSWMKSRGADKIEAVNTNHSKAKHRWFKKMGFMISYSGWKRRI